MPVNICWNFFLQKIKHSVVLNPFRTPAFIFLIFTGICNSAIHNFINLLLEELHAYTHMRKRNACKVIRKGFSWLILRKTTFKKQKF